MLTKSIVGLAALIAAGVVTVDSVVLTPGHAATDRIVVVPQSDADATADYQALRSQAAAAVNQLVAREKAGASAEPRCEEQAWPYYTKNCLVAENGSAPVRSVRIVEIGAQRVSF